MWRKRALLVIAKRTGKLGRPRADFRVQVAMSWRYAVSSVTQSDRELRERVKDPKVRKRVMDLGPRSWPTDMTGQYAD